MIKEATNLQGKNICNTIRSGGRGSMTEKHSWDVVKVGTWRTHKDGQGFRGVSDGNAPTIPARAREDGSGQPVVKMGAIRGRNPENPKSRAAGLPTEQMVEINENDQKANCLSTVQKDNCVVEPERIRRLTEIECERLQGFPDNHTQHGNYDGEVKQVSATQRYKCLGNAVTVDIVQLVGERILKCLAD